MIFKVIFARLYFEFLAPCRTEFSLRMPHEWYLNVWSLAMACDWIYKMSSVRHLNINSGYTLTLQLSTSTFQLFNGNELETCHLQFFHKRLFFESSWNTVVWDVINVRIFITTNTRQCQITFTFWTYQFLVFSLSQLWLVVLVCFVFFLCDILQLGDTENGWGN